MTGMEHDIEQLKAIAKQALRRKGHKRIEFFGMHFHDGSQQPYMIDRPPCFCLSFQNLRVLKPGRVIEDGGQMLCVEIDASTLNARVLKSLF
jgi:hypothetical protein